MDEIILSLSMESGGPKSILVSMSQAEHSPHLSRNITANILANRSGAICVGGDICDAYKNALEDKRGPPSHR